MKSEAQFVDPLDVPDTGDPAIDQYLRDIAPTLPAFLILDLTGIMAWFWREAAKLHMEFSMVENHRDEMIVMLLDYLVDDYDPYGKIYEFAEQFSEDYPGTTGVVLREMAVEIGGVLYHQLKHFQVFRYNEATELHCLYFTLEEWLDPNTLVIRRLDKLDFID